MPRMPNIRNIGIKVRSPVADDQPPGPSHNRGQTHTSPMATIARATLMKPATLAPTT
jgi:hypothetical protein